MANIIQDTFHRLWTTRKTKVTTGGWISGNAVCCPHNGQTQDKRGRGGIKAEANGSAVYHCFNCQFKARYVPGEQLSYPFRKLLLWMGAAESEIHRLVFEALREKELLSVIGVPPTLVEPPVKVNFKKFPLPAESTSFHGMIEFYALKNNNNYPAEFMNAASYALDRKINFDKYELYWSTTMPKRVIVPFIYDNEIVGYTARSTDGSLPKYLTEIDSGYVFNLNNQTTAQQIMIVMEGPFDAMAIDGVAVLHGEISKQQIRLLEAQNKEIIVVPDYEKSGSSLVQIAIDRGWSVSFPLWAEEVKDASAAVATYGKLFVLKDIIDNVERMKLKIELRWRKYENSSS